MKLSSFEALAAALDTAGVRYLIAGGLAVAAHGYLRFTKDVDIVIQLVPDNIERTFTALASVDVFVTEPFNFDAEYAAALLSPLNEGITVRFVPLPTLIRMKEEADRPQDHAGIEQLRARNDNNANN